MKVPVLPTFHMLSSKMFFTEPTSNVPPKKVGAEFGWRVLTVKEQQVAWLTCQVTGYPVPLFM